MVTQHIPTMTKSHHGGNMSDWDFVMVGMCWVTIIIIVIIIVIVITITIVIIIIIALRWVASLRSCNINAKEKGRKEGGSKAKFTR